MTGNAEVVRTWWLRCWNERDLGAIADCFAPEFTEKGKKHTPADFERLIEEAVAESPDFRVELAELHESGDRVVTRIEYQFTHSSPLFGVPATGAPITAIGLDLFRLQDGKIVEYWHCVDHLPILRRIEKAARETEEVAT